MQVNSIGSYYFFIEFYYNWQCNFFCGKKEPSGLEIFFEIWHN